jgi:hypothetical protein
MGEMRSGTAPESKKPQSNPLGGNVQQGDGNPSPYREWQVGTTIRTALTVA